MSEIEEWNYGRPTLIQFFAPQLAVTARDIHEAFNQINDRRILNHQFELPHLPSWFTLYRNHRKPLSFLRKMFSGFSHFSPESLQLGEDVIEGARLLGRQPQNVPISITQEELQQINMVKRSMLSESMSEIKEDMSQKSPDQQTKAAMLSLLSDMDLESSFFILVTAPCWLLYQMPPGRLYRKARQGNFNALQKLLNLDPLMIHDPAIGKQIQNFRFNNKYRSYEKLLEIPLKQSTIFVTPQQMKYALGGFLSALAKMLKVRLTAPDIQRLYDAVALDYDGIKRDSCLPNNSDTFARAIHRYRNEWLKAFESRT